MCNRTETIIYVNVIFDLLFLIYYLTILATIIQRWLDIHFLRKIKSTFVSIWLQYNVHSRNPPPPILIEVGVQPSKS